MAEKTEYIISLKDLFSKGVNDAAAAANNLDNKVVSLQSSVLKLASFIGVGALAKNVFDTTKKFETLDNVINFTSKSTSDAAENHKFLSDIIDKYKLPVLETTEGFSQLNAAMLGSRLQGEGTRKIFEGVSVATTAMHLSAEQSQSVFLALNQMMSKGKVQAQEMTLQLGQSLPGALRLASKSMNMSTAEFSKAMENGLVSSEVFLPRFAQTLKDTFSGAIPNAILSLQARETEMNNSFIETKLIVGEELKPVMMEFLKDMTLIIKTIPKLIGFIKDHSAGIKAVALGIGVAITLTAAWSTAIKLNIWYTGLSTSAIVLNTLVTEGWTAAQIALNMAMTANPIGVVIAAVATLSAGLYLLIQRYEKLKESYVTQAQNEMLGALKEEISLVKTAADNYEKLGKTKKEAQNLAIQDENIRNARQIAKLEGELVWQKTHSNNADIEATEKQIALLKSFKQKLPTIFDKPTANGNTKIEGPIKNAAGIDSAKSPEHKVITINIDKLIEKFTIATSTVAEGAASIKEQVVKALIEAVNDSQIIAGV